MSYIEQILEATPHKTTVWPVQDTAGEVRMNT